MEQPIGVATAISVAKVEIREMVVWVDSATGRALRPRERADAYIGDYRSRYASQWPSVSLIARRANVSHGTAGEALRVAKKSMG